MSILSVLQTVERLHNAYGQLSEVVDTLETFQRAANFNPRSSDDWDVLGLRDDEAQGIIRALTRVQSRTRNLGRETGYVPNYSAETRRLFTDWAEAYANRGRGSRQAQAAQYALYRNLYDWADRWQREWDGSVRAARRMRLMRRFYVQQRDLFADLKTIAEAFVRHWPNSATQAAALAQMLQFEEIRNRSGAIANAYAHGLSAVARWQSGLRGAETEMRAWLHWSQNRSDAERDAIRGRAPR